VEAKVELGLRRAGEVEVLSGLPRKATVVTAGHQRLRNGAAVEVILSGTEAGARAGG
jgi:membrane fusion protein (multidrug efflux system)